MAVDDDASLGLRIRSARKVKGLSIKEVAETTGLTSSLISQFERGMTGISLNSLRRIANALELPIASLFAEVDLHVVRASQRQTILRPEANVPFSLASPDGFSLRLLECRLAPGQATSLTPVSHPGRECTLVMSGQVRAVVAEQECELSAGDSITLDSRHGHQYLNTGTGEAVLVMVIDAYASMS